MTQRALYRYQHDVASRIGDDRSARVSAKPSLAVCARLATAAHLPRRRVVFECRCGHRRVDDRRGVRDVTDAVVARVINGAIFLASILGACVAQGCDWFRAVSRTDLPYSRNVAKLLAMGSVITGPIRPCNLPPLSSVPYRPTLY